MRFFFSLFVCAKQELRGARYEIDLWMKDVGWGGEWGMREAGLLAVRVARGPGVWCVLYVS